MNISISPLFFFIFFWACNTSEEIKMRRYQVSGERLYLQYCANCHQPDGRGFKKLYPPMDSIFMADRIGETLCLIKFGSSDTIIIGQVEYTLPMPPTHLTNLELAEISTYIYSEYAGRKSIIDVREFTKAIDSCSIKTYH